ncbi:MAG: hypothetical protein ACN4GZ_20375 [Acidimicrobiales bacterium]
MTRFTRSGTERHRLRLATLIVLVVLGGAVASIASTMSAGAEEPWVESGWSGGELPNLSVVLRSISSSDPNIEGRLLPAVRDIAGVESAFLDVLPAGPPVLHLVVGDPGQLDRVTSEVEELSAGLAQGELLIGGQLLADAEVNASITTSAFIAFVPVVVILGFVVAALHGSVVGLAAGLSSGLSALLGGMIGSSVTGSFDGSLSTTVLPGALAGLLVGVTLVFRLISWFQHPDAEDAADNILHSVLAQLPDLGLVLGGLGLLAAGGFVLDGWNAPVAVFMGALFGALATLATMPALLSTRGSVHDNAEFRAVPIKVPDGRDLPMAVLVVVALLLLGLGAVAARGNSSPTLLDASESDTEAAQISEQLVRLGGDPAAAIRATAPSGSENWFAEWANSASRYPGVDWVATSSGRFENGVMVSDASSAPPLDDRTAIINPSESARSQETQATVRALQEIEADGAVRLEGLPVDAEATAHGADRALWVMVCALSLLAGLAVLILVGDLGLAVVVVAVRLLTSSACLGAYYVVVETPTAGGLQIVLLVLSIGVSLFEIGILRMILMNEESPFGSVVSAAMRSGGGHPIAGLVVVGLTGVGLLASSVELVAAFGIALAVAVLIEVVLGIWLLRPVIVGEQTLRSVSPGIRGRTIMGRRGPSEGEPVNPEWRRVVSGLLREEFRFQTEPDQADLGTVFVEDTPLFGELAQHNLRLRQNGLKIRGEGPTVVSVKAVNDGEPVTVAITVDHPSRQLLSADGKLLGVRAAERRDGMLWLAQDPSGRYRISEAVDMGSGVPIPEAPKVEAVS